MTGKTAGVRYTVLVADDDGGGSVILPGPNGFDLRAQDFGSTVFIARAKRDIGLSFVGVLATDREHHHVSRPASSSRRSGAYNRVVGPDFQWRPSGTTSWPGSGSTATRGRRTARISRTNGTGRH